MRVMSNLPRIESLNVCLDGHQEGMLSKGTCHPYAQATTSRTKALNANNTGMGVPYPIIHREYSGKNINPETVKAIASAANRTRGPSTLHMATMDFTTKPLTPRDVYKLC